MFGPSVKSVPGWWVSIVPILIGVPLAALPGDEPHDDVSTLDEPPLLLVLAALDALDDAPPELDELLLLLLLPHPVSASSATAARAASPTRIRGRT
ncbi:MAG: hypothetical protein WBQ18_19865 [Solirubrobacteraceae bacterium]